MANNTRNTHTTYKHKNIKVALWNANSVYGKMGEIEHFMKIHEVDIFAISEKKLAPHVDFNIRNFTVHRQDRNRRGGGVAIIIKNSLAHIRLPQTNSAIEHVTLKLWNGIVVSSCYSPPSYSILDSDLDSLMDLAPRVLLLGDFNARHTTWKNPINNKNGETLFDYVTTNAIQILCTDTPT